MEDEEREEGKEEEGEEGEEGVEEMAEVADVVEVEAKVRRSDCNNSGFGSSPALLATNDAAVL